jgi:hypothetical protein
MHSGSIALRPTRNLKKDLKENARILRESFRAHSQMQMSRRREALQADRWIMMG